jgi:cysteine synthase A
MGSVKDRAAAYALARGLESGEIRKDSWVVESSSGNFGVALAAYCKHHGLPFHCVVDPRISPLNEAMIRRMGATVEKVSERDHTGGYLLTRLATVQRFVEAYPNAYWMNQYGNPLVADAYYHTLGEEICGALPRVDYAFVAVSSGGTIAGLSRKLKERFPRCRVVAVDCEGSVVFGGPPRPRYIPGIGSSIVPPILKAAKIDDVMVLGEIEAIGACHRLLAEHGVFAGGSSGFVIAAIERYFAERPADHAPGRRPVVVGVLPDRGERYAATVYDDAWCAKLAAGTLGDDEELRTRT